MFFKKQLAQLFVVVPFFSLSQVNIQDQFDKTANWAVFQNVPKVLILQGRGVKDQEQGGKWGSFISGRFNGGFSSGIDTVATLNPQEKVKILAVAAIPDVPKFLHGMVKNKVKANTPDRGVLVDFSSKLSQRLTFDEKSPVPAIAVIPSDAAAPKLGNQIEVIFGNAEDPAIRAQVEQTIVRALSVQ